MKSFTIKLQDFFKLNNSDRDQEINFDPSKRQLLIPLYQREYKWTRDKVQVLINDIKQRDKFLGIVILDETQDCYEIVDGQQRITTCFLALLALYNYYRDSEFEQRSLMSYIAPYGEYILKNDSVGEYIVQNGNALDIQIDSANDIYFQDEAFRVSYCLISDFVSPMLPEEVREFKRQLLDCEILVMINNQHGNTRPVEQIFLDINEKSQLLEVEDIFKGHCFENFDIAYHQELKEKWTDLKRCGMRFKQDFGFKDVSQYIYLYMLECVDKEMPENLSPNDRHYLEGKSMDDTMSCLKAMISYGENVIAFRENLDDTTYRFSDLCRNSHEYRNTNDHEFMKRMSSYIIDCKAAQYQKLPFMQFINHMTLSNDLQSNFSHLDFRKSIVNLYIYAALFVYMGGRKSKKDVDQSVLSALQSLSIRDIVAATKALRIAKVEGFSLSGTAKEEELRFVYSVSDFYVSNNTWFSEMYVNNGDCTPEHFLIPDNKRRHIVWKSGETDKHIYLSSKYSTTKKRAINFLIIDKTLNESLHEYDIVSKIEMIREWFEARHEALPNHVHAVIEAIEQMPEYQALALLKDDPAASETGISMAYSAFLDAYFDKEAEGALLSKLTECFRNAFRNQDAE